METATSQCAWARRRWRTDGWLDEAVLAATGGDLDDHNTIASTCCYMVHACERVRDPGSDPACGDGVWQAFFNAYVAGTEPDVERLGISYMLLGSNSASNVDPFASAPPSGHEWLIDGPHLMLLVPDPAMLEGLPVEHSSEGEPYVMFAGTPYAHVMVPLGSR